MPPYLQHRLGVRSYDQCLYSLTNSYNLRNKSDLDSYRQEGKLFRQLKLYNYIILVKIGFLSVVVAWGGARNGKEKQWVWGIRGESIISSTTNIKNRFFIINVYINKMRQIIQYKEYIINELVNN